MCHFSRLQLLRRSRPSYFRFDQEDKNAQKIDFMRFSDIFRLTFYDVITIFTGVNSSILLNLRLLPNVNPKPSCMINTDNLI